MAPEDREERDRAERAAADDEAGMTAEEFWYAMNDGWVQ